jgi:acetyl-CoA acetyltransferase
MVAQRRDNSWQRNREGLGLWPHRGKVAVAGWGNSPIQRRWDGVSLDTTLGSYATIAAQRAMEDAGITMDDIDGIMTSPESRVGDTWSPRPYPGGAYTSEDGLTVVSAEWLIKNMGFDADKIKFTDSEAPQIGAMMGKAAQAVGDGQCEVLLCYYPMGNIEGRYSQGGENATDEVRGNAVWSNPWGYQSGAMMNSLMVYCQYCREYGYDRDGMLAKFAVNQRRNGLMTPWGFYTQHEPYQITIEDYLNNRYVMEPLRVFDCDRPVCSVAAFIFTTAERAKDMKQSPVYVLGHAQANDAGRSSMGTLQEHQASCDSLARKMWEATGLGPADVDVFNPYDGYLTFTQQFLEGFQWHGVKRGEAMAFYNSEDLRVAGPHPYLSSGGNNGTGRTRSALHSDSIEQLRGQAGPRQIQIRCETALAGSNNPGAAGFIMYSKSPD